MNSIRTHCVWKDTHQIRPQANAATAPDSVTLQVYVTSCICKRCQLPDSVLRAAGGVSKPRAGDCLSGSCTGSACPTGRPCASGGSSLAVAACRSCAAAGSACAAAPTASGGSGHRSHRAHCPPHAGQCVGPTRSPSAAAAAAPTTAGAGSAAAAAGGAATACTGAARSACAPSGLARLCFGAAQQRATVQCRSPAVTGGRL